MAERAQHAGARADGERDVVAGQELEAAEEVGHIVARRGLLHFGVDKSDDVFLLVLGDACGNINQENQRQVASRRANPQP